MNIMNASQLVQWFCLSFPELTASMKSTSHNYTEAELNPYHLEGDVWTHTCMVLKTCEVYQSIGEDIDLIDFINCILHDIGKPKSIQVLDDKKRNRFLGHEGMSVYLAIPVLDKLIEENYITEDDKITILYCIGMHGAFRDRMDEDCNIKPKYEKEVETTFIDNYKLLKRLHILMKCDGMGRFHI